MIYRHTLSILDWHEDGTSASTIWEVSPKEREQIALMLEHRPATHGLITKAQADEAKRATRDWLTMPKTQTI